jgi:hypothetical protein
MIAPCCLLGLVDVVMEMSVEWEKEMVPSVFYPDSVALSRRKVPLPLAIIVPQ